MDGDQTKIGFFGPDGSTKQMVVPEHKSDDDRYHPIVMPDQGR